MGRSLSAALPHQRENRQGSPGKYRNGNGVGGNGGNRAQQQRGPIQRSVGHGSKGGHGQQQQHGGGHRHRQCGNTVGHINTGGNGKGGTDAGRHGAKGQAYRRLWQQVTAVGKGGKLGSRDAGGYEATVEDLLEVVRHLPPESSAVKAVACGLYSLDSGALAALLKELNKAGQARRAQEIFDWLRGLDASHDLYGLCNTMTYTTMISQCGSQQALRRALELIAEMRGRGIQCNVHTYSALMNVCIKANEMDLALDVYRQMLTEGSKPNLVTYNTLIDVYGKTGQWEEAIAVLDALEQQGIEPEVRTYNTVIIACNQSSRATEALHVYERMLAAGAQPTATTYTALISAYGKAGQLDSALEIFQDMVRRGCERNVITYSSLISACEKAGRWELALELFREMHIEGCRPNVVTYNSLIAACAQGGQWEKAQELFEKMQKKGCRPDNVTFGGLIAAFDRGGQWRRALVAFDDMKSFNCRPDTVVYNTIIGALWRTGLLWAQNRATQIFHAACRQGHFRLSVHALGANTSKKDQQLTNTNTSVTSGSSASTPNGSLELDTLSLSSTGHPSQVISGVNNQSWIGMADVGFGLADISSLQGTQASITPSLSEMTSGIVTAACVTPSTSAAGSPLSPNALASGTPPATAGESLANLKTRASGGANHGGNGINAEEIRISDDGASLHCIEFGMHAFTVGSAVLSLLRWITELRDRLPHDASRIDPQQHVALVLNKGKPSREHSYPAIRAAITAMLSSWDSPFSFADIPQGCRIEAKAKDVVEWLLTAPAERALIPFTARSSDICHIGHRESAFQEDSMVEKRCYEAFAAVLGFEASGLRERSEAMGSFEASMRDENNGSVKAACAFYDEAKSCEMNNAFNSEGEDVKYGIEGFYAQRAEWFRTAAMLAAAFAYSDEALYDGFLLADRALAAIRTQELQIGVSLAAIIVASLAIAAEQAGERVPVSFASDPAAESAAGLQPGEADAALNLVKSLLHGDTSSISCLRVLKLYLERLGAEFGKNHSDTLWLAAGTSLRLLPCVMCDERLMEQPPSIVAAAVLLAGRKAAGLSPFWPTSLGLLTGLWEHNEDDSPSNLSALADRISISFASSTN